MLSSAAPEDIRVEVRLVPGSGNHPAVPGEDFVDQPVEMTIPGGATSGRVTIQLLRNDGQQENRSLSATVSLFALKAGLLLGVVVGSVGLSACGGGAVVAAVVAARPRRPEGVLPKS